MRRPVALVAIAWSAASLCVAVVPFSLWVAGLSALDPDPRPRAGVIAASWAVTGAALVTARPRNALGWLLVAVGALQAASAAGNGYGGYGVGIADPDWPAARWVAWGTSMVWLPSLVLPATVLLALYPDGRLPARWWRWPVGAAVTGLTGLTVVATLTPESYNDIAPGDSPLALPTGWWTVGGVVAAAALLAGGTVVIWAATVVRVLRATSPQRQQLTWLACVVVPLVLFAFLFEPGVFVAAVLLPVAIGVGVLRYALLGIVLRRALVYGALTAVVLAAYLLASVLLGATMERGVLPGVVVAALVAVGLSPARARLQAAADRFVYGDRADPVRAVQRLGSRVADAPEADLLAAVLVTVTAALRAPGAQVLDPDGRLLAGTGTVEAAESVPLRVAGRDVGTLRVGHPVGERLTPGEHRLLGALGPQVAVVVRALELAQALARERDRVVAATRDERDRLRRDLHDGLGPSLTGMGLGLQALRDALGRDDRGTAAVIGTRLAAESDNAVREVRRILDDLRPAVLDDADLTGAVRRHAAAVSATLPVEVVAEPLPALPVQVETAALRIAQEALTNVVRHSGATRATVSLAAEGDRLVVAVQDDGRGYGTGPEVDGGVGLRSMRRRAEALGGHLHLDGSPDGRGASVVATLPLHTDGTR